MKNFRASLKTPISALLQQPLTRCFRPGSFRNNFTQDATGRLASSTSKEPIVEYSWIPGVETLSSYRPGGYHPVMIGDTLHDRYIIADKLGFGGYSTVWLARDTLQKKYVALKINTSSVDSREARLLKSVFTPASLPLALTDGVSWIPQCLDEFFVEGPNGKHSCYTVSPARSDLRETSFSRLFTLEVSHAIAYELVLAASYLHSRGVVHGGIVCTLSFATESIC